MDGVMSEAQAQETLLASMSLYAHIQPTIEPDDEFVRLEQRLVCYNCIRYNVTTDDNCLGNCVMRAILDHTIGVLDSPEEVRQAGVARLVLFPHLYEEYIDPEDGETYQQYVARVAREDEDVDALFMQAICDAYGVRIVELVPKRSYCIAEFTPFNKRVTETIWIASSSRHTDAMYHVN